MPRGASVWERVFEALLHDEGLALGMEREYRFHPKRRWRFDFAWPEKRIAVEVEGGVWQYGRHNRAIGFLRDMEKYNEAAALGWTVLRVAPEHIKDGRAVAWLRRAMAAKGQGADCVA